MSKGLGTESLHLVTYLNRSGSSFLFERLSRNGNICTCLEAEVLIYNLLMKPYEKFGDKSLNLVFRWAASDPKLKYWQLGEDDLFALSEAESNLEAFICILKAYKNRWFPNASAIAFKGTKLIDFFTSFPDLLNGRPFTPYVLLRDPRAIYNSQRRNTNSVSGQPFARNPVCFSFQWNGFVRKLNVINHVDPVRYEDLIANPERRIGIRMPFGLSGSLCSGAGNYYARLPRSQAHLHPNILLQPKPERVDAWKAELGKKEIHTIDRITRNYRRLFGYESVDDSTPTASKMCLWVYATSAAGYYSLIYLRRALSKISRILK